MATSRIPGPYKAESDLYPSELDKRWQSFGTHHRFQHVPGPLGSWDERSWKVVGFEAPAGRENVDELYDDIKRWEGVVLFMYLDSKGLVTVGVGNLLRTVEAARLLPFANTSTGEPATVLEIDNAFEAVKGMEAKKKPSVYELSPSIELTEEDTRALAFDRLRNEFLPALRRFFPEFDSYPPSARRFMVDMAYNGGVGFFKRRLMDGLIEEQRWLRALDRLPTEGNPRRKAWREALLRAAAEGR